ncbi:MAG: aminotransferase class III-fold pyridoxal phosphate-dependent enzyme, partial [Planctomycetota bacterium]
EDQVAALLEGPLEAHGGLAQLDAEHQSHAAHGPDAIRLRGMGLMLGIELRQSSVGLQRALQERGYLVLGAGPRVVRLLPPLISAEADLERLGAAIVEELSR